MEKAAPGGIVGGSARGRPSLRSAKCVKGGFASTLPRERWGENPGLCLNAASAARQRWENPAFLSPPVPRVLAQLAPGVGRVGASLSDVRIARHTEGMA